MAIPYPSCLVSASARFQPLTDKNCIRIEPPFLLGFKSTYRHVEKRHHCFNVKHFFGKSGPKLSCAMNMSAQESDDHQNINLDHLIAKAQKLWDRSPQPVKNFPWNTALENFIQLILDLSLSVVKYLSVPVFAISSLSELSYCAHQKKLFFVPVPVLLGFTIAGILAETALDSSARLKVAEVPWHLIAIAILFTLIKLPGPYYPYWGRILIPHFTNGVLLRTLWLAILWHRRPQRTLKTPNSDGTH
ncbi:hypothetical protein QN277_005146 [Acacia crassicarpa]|uniref:Uncharacterized protein n=1 Tax=Acacia crassicarpa TaxID=499986 RepID=A0AAE1MG32_9FABA|nr:hypothetical protein QN277_005146 [Acacia crassicarpa]